MRKWLALVIAVALLGAALFATAPGAQAKWAHCHSFGCVNKKLNALHKKQQRLKAAVFKCERLAAVTSYFGYWYGASGDFTSALDYTDTGDTPSDWMVVDVCGPAKRKLAPLSNSIQRKR